MVDTNSTQCSWEELISAIENCGDKYIAVIMRRQLEINDEVINLMLIYLSLVLLYRYTYSK